MRIGIIGGSGLYNIDGLTFIKQVEINTPYGSPSGSYAEYTFNGHHIYFLPRHGEKHSFAPHAINYRANIDGFRQLKADKIVAVSATGGIDKSPGAVIIPDNGIDMTHGRLSTFFDGPEIYHIDMTTPFCESTRLALIKSAEMLDIRVSNGVSICTNGPRLETAAEIKAYAAWGADIVGMTLFPECVLAREAGICYANISVVTNYAAGRQATRLTSAEVTEMMRNKTEIIQKILRQFFSLKSMDTCECGPALADAKISR